MCRQTQRTWLGGEYPSTSHAGGLATPDYTHIASAYGIMPWRAQTMASAEAGLELWRGNDGPQFLELVIDDGYQIIPQVRAGRLLHDAAPALPREEIERIMA